METHLEKLERESKEFWLAEAYGKVDTSMDDELNEIGAQCSANRLAIEQLHRWVQRIQRRLEEVEKAAEVTPHEPGTVPGPPRKTRTLVPRARYRVFRDEDGQLGALVNLSDTLTEARMMAERAGAANLDTFTILDTWTGRSICP